MCSRSAASGFSGSRLFGAKCSIIHLGAPVKGSRPQQTATLCQFRCAVQQSCTDGLSRVQRTARCQAPPAGFRFSVRSTPLQFLFAVPLHGGTDTGSALPRTEPELFSLYTFPAGSSRASRELCTKSALVLEIDLTSRPESAIIIMYSYAGLRRNSSRSAPTKC